MLSAALLMLVSSIVPHHHHDDTVCMITQHCGDEGAENDRHTGHSESDMEHGSYCVAGSDFVVNQSGKDTRCKVSPRCDDSDRDHVHLFPIPSKITDTPPGPAETAGPEYEYGEYVSFCTSAGASRSHGLRAPPFI